MVFGVPAWALLVLAVTVGGWALLLMVLTTATRARPVRPGPATLDLPGEEPPAVVNLLTNGWRMTTDALSATLLDLAARDMIDLVQTGPEPERTICRIREPAPPHLTPYERRVYDRVSGLAADGVVPVAALPQGSPAQAARWWKAFRREVILDAQHRGLSRNRWSAGIIAWAGFSGYATSRNRQRDTPAGREVAAGWMGVRDHLRRNEVFDTLPPAAVAIWDRYLGYGAAGGVAGTASRVLSFGAQDERLAWSAFGGTWHKVRIRYPGNRAAEGRHPALAALIGAVAMVVGWYGTRGVLGVRRALEDESLGLSEDTVRALDSPWTDLVLLVLGAGFVTVGVWGAWVVLRAALDLGGRRTFQGEVLRVRAIRNDEGATIEYQVAVDDGRSERTRAWPVPVKRMPTVSERDVVTMTVGPWLRHVFAITVDRHGPRVVVDDGRRDLDREVIEEPAGTVGVGGPLGTLLSGGNAAVGAVDPATLFSAAEVGAALGRPVGSPRTLHRAVFGMPSLRTTEFVALDGQARVLVQAMNDRLAATIGADRGESLPGGARLRDGSVVLRTSEALVAIHARHVDPATADSALRHLAALATVRLRSTAKPIP